MIAELRNPTYEATIRDLIDDWAAAIRAKDIDTIMTKYCGHVQAFDLLPPMQYEGKEAMQQRLTEWFNSFEGEIDFEMREVSIMASESVAFYHSLNGVKGTTKTGQNIDMWWRATVGYENQEGTWRIVHAHSSEPFDMTTGKAITDWKP
jgi:uncharacterized protein (TIGR02246 family)